MFSSLASVELSNYPLCQAEVAENPSSQAEVAEIPSSQVAVAEIPSSQVEVAEIPSSQVAVAEIPSSQAEEDEIPSSLVAVAEMPSSQVAVAEMPSPHVDMKGGEAGDARRSIPLIPTPVRAPMVEPAPKASADSSAPARRKISKKTSLVKPEPKAKAKAEAAPRKEKDEVSRKMHSVSKLFKMFCLLHVAISMMFFPQFNATPECPPFVFLT